MFKAPIGMRKGICIALCCFFSLMSTAQTIASTQEQDLAIIQRFIETIAQDELRADVILSQQVLMEKEVDNDAYDYLEASIDEIRLNVQLKDLNQIEYFPFSKLPRAETRDIDTEGKSTDKMYFLKYKGRLLLSVYIDKDKIASFTLVSKGDSKAHFVTY